MKKLFICIALLLPSLSQAEEYNYKVKGMHCGGCVKAIKAKVCNMEGIDKCDVEVGSLKITTKNNIKFTPEQIQQAVEKAGEYSIEK